VHSVHFVAMNQLNLLYGWSNWSLGKYLLMYPRSIMAKCVH